MKNLNEHLLISFYCWAILLLNVSVLKAFNNVFALRPSGVGLKLFKYTGTTQRQTPKCKIIMWQLQLLVTSLKYDAVQQ